MTRKQAMIKMLVIVLVIMALSIVLQGCTTAEVASVNTDEFQITFKLDDRLFGPTYGGERWVPPPYGPIAYSGTYTLEARAYYVDAVGQQVAIAAEWIPADPSLVTVVPGEEDQVLITIQGLGETSLLVKTSQGTSKMLYIKASAQNENVHLVEISQ